MDFPESEDNSSGEPVLQVHNTSGLSIPLNHSTFQKILDLIQKTEKVVFSLIEVVYVDTGEIQRINNEYLDRDYITDIISFRYDEKSDLQSVEGTLYCCAPRIIEQSKEYNSSPEEEFSRIFIHGLLHLIGYEDQSDTDKRTMTEREEHYLHELAF